MSVVRGLLTFAAAGAAFAVSVPASASVIVGSGDVGSEYVFDFTGLVDGNTETGLSALMTLTFNGVTNGGLTYNFDYDVANDSTLVARLSGFGFNTNPNPAVSLGTVDGTYAIVASGNMPQFGSLDICFKDGGGVNNCGGGGSGGVFSNATASGSFSVNFGSALDSVTLSDFTTRFQSIEGSNYGSSGIGIGTNVPAVPEPGTWALMLLGFGAVGWTMRRRKTAGGEQRIRFSYN